MWLYAWYIAGKSVALCAWLRYRIGNEQKGGCMVRCHVIFFVAASLAVSSAFAQTYDSKSKSETKVKGTEVKTKSQSETKTPGSTIKSKSETTTRGGVVVKSKTQISEKTKSIKTKPVKTKKVLFVQRDINQLEPLLVGVNSTATINSETWMRLANEANMLANRIYANTRSTPASAEVINAARDLRTQVQMFRTEVRTGNMAGARVHAQEALTLAYRIDQWSS